MSRVRNQGIWLFIILLFATVLGVFIISGLVEMIRYYIFKWLKIKEKLLGLENKYLNKLK